MRQISIAACALNQTPLDWDGNLSRAGSALAQARERGASLVLMPELCLSGYGCEDAFLGADIPARSWSMLEALLPQTVGIVASFGLPCALDGKLYNAAAVCVDGKLVGLAAKQHLAGDGIHYEPRWFSPWPPGERADLERDGALIPMGDLIFDVGGVRLGFEICEDAWVANRPGLGHALRGVDVILNPSASHFAFGKQELRRRLVLDGSRSFDAAYVYANLVGNEAGRVIYDGGALIASRGELVAAGDRLGFGDSEVTLAQVELGARRGEQGGPGASEGADPTVLELPFTWPAERASSPPQAALPRALSKEEEFARAVSLGLHDYLRKSRSRGFVVSLSGGADSTATVALVKLSVDLALAELGPAALAERLGTQAPGDGRWLAGLLTTVYQSTSNSSEATRSAARVVAESVGSTHHELDVDGLVGDYVALAEGALERRLEWERDDLALQNVQARVRAPGVWLLANVLGALLLATSNRSEAAVGYATMDGDTCGGLSPLAGIDKAFLRRWLVWLEREGAQGIEPMPALSVVNELAPTAELRPASAEQTDESDLMPYPVLDAIERHAIRDKRSPAECLQLVGVDFPEHSAACLLEWVVRFFRLWSRNQWKRERYAPSFHLDDENLDPKTWCRFPILSGGFERELAELTEGARGGA